jgi:hypothetical protein
MVVTNGGRVAVVDRRYGLQSGDTINVVALPIPEQARLH